VGGGKGVEVNRLYGVEELALVENTKDIACDESTQRVTSNGEFCYSLVRVFLEIFNVGKDLNNSQQTIPSKLYQAMSGNIPRL
jgi:hypothetical protein